jgi:hypothetical protein
VSVLCPACECLLTLTDDGTDPAKTATDKLSALRLGELQVQVHRCSSFYAPPRGPVDAESDLPAISEKALVKREVTHGATCVLNQLG